jgi:hypothetical protein
VEVDLDRVALGGDEALLQPAFVVGDLLRISPPRAARAAVEQVGDPFGLGLGDRHDRAERLDEADEVEARVLDRDDAR